jgi:hypothetical protein
LNGVNAGFKLGDHAARNRPIGKETGGLFQRNLINPARGVRSVTSDAIDIGKEDQLLGTKGRSQCASDGVGIDVVGLPEIIGAYGRNHRYEVLS